MSAPSTRSASLRSRFHELGPLRFVAVYVAVAMTAGTLALLALLPTIAAVWGRFPVWQEVGLVAGIAAATAGALVLPNAAAFAAGYLAASGSGFLIAVLGAGAGSVLAQRVVAPALGARLFPFMRERPRANAVRRLCGTDGPAATMGVARLRWASVVPVPIANLLFAVASVPLPAVLLGNVVGAAPPALFFAVAGECWCGYCATGELPRASLLVAAGAALLGTVVLRRASRKHWRAAMVAVETAAV